MKWTMAIAVLGLAASAWAVKPVTVSHATEADFASGEADNAVVWSQGEVTLGRAAETILDAREDVLMVSAIAAGADGAAYVGTAPKGLIFRIGPDGEVAQIADLESAIVTDLLVDGASLLAATAGDQAGIYRITVAGRPDTEAAATRLWSDPEAGAVWDIAMADGTLYAATGPNGKLYAIDAAGAGREILSAKQEIIRSVLVAGGRVYAGTGSEGLVYRIDLASGRSRVLLDAAENEIVGLALDAAGNLYAAASNGGPGRPSEPDTADVGRAAPPAPATKPAAEEGPQAVGEGEPTTRQATPTSAPATVEPTTQAVPTTQPAEQSLEALTPPAEPAATGPAAAATAPTRPSRPARTAGGAGQQGAPANRVYRIDPEGLVLPVAAPTETILAMTMHGDKLYLATGGSGLVYEADPRVRASAAIAKLDPKNASAIAVAPDGTLLVGTAGPAIAVRVGADLAERGTLVSKAIDAGQIARWGRLRVQAQAPSGATVNVATRSGNVEDPDEATWSDWSDEMPADPAWTAIASPAGRFLQYRLTFTPDAAGQAGVVDEIQLSYQVANLPPQVAAVVVTPSDKPQPSRNSGEKAGPLRYRIVQYKAADPNDDSLSAAIYYRKRGATVWIRAAENITEPAWVWDTATVGDGQYELKVEASDSPSNPPGIAMTDSRISRPVTVDNTAPVLDGLAATPDGAGKVNLRVIVRDAASRVEHVEYVVNSGEVATVLAPADGIYDSLEETATGTIADLKPGAHVITVRARDEYGNVGVASIEVTVGRE